MVGGLNKRIRKVDNTKADTRRRLGAWLYFPTANGKDSSEVGKMRMLEGMKKPRAGELQGA